MEVAATAPTQARKSTKLSRSVAHDVVEEMGDSSTSLATPYWHTMYQEEEAFLSLFTKLVTCRDSKTLLASIQEHKKDIIRYVKEETADWPLQERAELLLYCLPPISTK